MFGPEIFLDSGEHVATTLLGDLKATLHVATITRRSKSVNAVVFLCTLALMLSLTPTIVASKIAQTSPHLAHLSP